MSKRKKKLVSIDLEDRKGPPIYFGLGEQIGKSWLPSRSEKAEGGKRLGNEPSL